MRESNGEVSGLPAEYVIGPANQMLDNPIPGEGWRKLMERALERQERFKELADAWIENTTQLPTAEPALTHETGQALRSMGMDAVEEMNRILREKTASKHFFPEMKYVIIKDSHPDLEIETPPSIESSLTEWSNDVDEALRAYHAEENRRSKDSKIEEQFIAVATDWLNETYHHAFAAKALGHTAYQELVDMGPSVIPHIADVLHDPDNSAFFWMDLLADINRRYIKMPEEAEPHSREGWVDWADRIELQTDF